MKTLFLILVLYCGLLCAESANVIYLDKSHQSSKQEISKSHKDYLITPTDNLTVNISQLKFKKKGLFKKSWPNFVQLIFDDENMFSLNIEAKQQVVDLNAETLKVISGEFDGFKLGQRVVILLGNLKEKNKQFSMDIQWLGALRVAEDVSEFLGSAHELCYHYIYELGASKEAGDMHHYCVEAAATDSPTSLTLLAETYYFGHGVVQDYQQAGQWFEKAARLGHMHAQFMMYYTYVIRLAKTSTDQQKSLAVEYLNKAADAGYQKAINELKKRK